MGGEYFLTICHLILVTVRLMATGATRDCEYRYPIERAPNVIDGKTITTTSQKRKIHYIDKIEKHRFLVKPIHLPCGDLGISIWIVRCFPAVIIETCVMCK